MEPGLVYGDQTLAGNEPNQTKADIGELCQTTSTADTAQFDPAATGGPTLMGTGCNYVKKNATVVIPPGAQGAWIPARPSRLISSET